MKYFLDSKKNLIKFLRNEKEYTVDGPYKRESEFLLKDEGSKCIIKKSIIHYYGKISILLIA